jgi:hypothetical protein
MLMHESIDRGAMTNQCFERYFAVPTHGINEPDQHQDGGKRREAAQRWSFGSYAEPRSRIVGHECEGAA